MFDIVSGKLGWAAVDMRTLLVAPKGGCVEVVVVHDEVSKAHNLEPVYGRLCDDRGIKVGIGCERRKMREASIARAKMGRQKIYCHRRAKETMTRLPR
jgi:hypothetical protein